MNAKSSAATDGRTTEGAQRVIEAAKALFLEKGYAGASMARVAEAAGMQKASVYHHFPSKEALFVACVTAGYESVLERLRAVRDREELNHAERLRAVLEIAHETIVCSPVGRMSPLIAETSRAIPSVARSFWDEHIARMHEIVGCVVDKGVEEGAFRRLDPITFELMVFGPIVYVSLSNQMFSRFKDLADHFDADRTRVAHIDVVLRLLATG